MWRRNTKYVHVMHLRGNIDPTMTYKVYKALKSFKGSDSVALGLVINSQGGSPAQAYQIAKRIEDIKARYNLPVYTFAEDYAMSAAFFLHQIGDKRFCDINSLLGKAGTSI
jgi:ClpP class serine protease